MAHGKHIGKVVMKIREEENEIHCLPRPITVKAVRRTLCNPQHVYLIVGGLGGIGLELAHWLFLRGGKKFVLTSRSGVKTGYQARCLNFWRKNGVKVTISNLDVSDYGQTVQLLREAEKLGPIGGIFNLAMVLRDCLFENQSAQNFCEAAAPKYYGTKNLDKASRQICDS
uniref:Ketoreductase (KR) domain-containing protein n=1 Tax=Romanomermis culicivorax TaxID=13658 RepID=A0A915ISR1_ROMCU